MPSGFSCFAPTRQQEVVADRRGVLDLIVRIPAHLLAETTYTVNVTVYTVLGKETKVVLDNALTFMAYGHETGAQLKRGALAPRLDWTDAEPRRVPARSASPPSDAAALGHRRGRGPGLRRADARGLAVPAHPLVLLASRRSSRSTRRPYLGPAWIFIRTLVPLGVGSFVFGRS